jgi:tRNA pseudouridine55 synthase
MNGLLVFDKPPGLTSHDVVSLVRRATGERSVGHLGTLDPMATGVLPLLLGKWTRLAQFFGAAEKHYAGTVRFGWATDTYDAEGQPAAEPLPLQHTLAELQAMSTVFSGTIDQMPPVFSAKKIGGIPAYKLARAGKEVPVKVARITIHNFALISLEGESAAFTMHVSAGGYVRSVAHELGALAGCGAHLSALRRTQAGPFTLAEAVTREQLIAAANDGSIEALLLHPRAVLAELPAVHADEAAQTKLRNGGAVNLPEFSDAPLVRIFSGQRMLLGVGRRVAGTLIQPFVNLA